MAHLKNVLIGLTEELNPDESADFLVLVDTSISDLKKTKPENITIASDGGINGILSPPRTITSFYDEFDGDVLNPQWTKTNSATIESYDDKVRSALWCEHAGSSSDVFLSSNYSNGGNFSMTICCMVKMTSNFHLVSLRLEDAGGTNDVGIQLINNSTPTIRSVKLVSGVFTQLNSTAPTMTGLSYVLLHIQRISGNWEWYYSLNGVDWTLLTASTAVPFTVAKVKLQFGTGGSATKTYTMLHWIRENWITI